MILLSKQLMLSPIRYHKREPIIKVFEKSSQIPFRLSHLHSEFVQAFVMLSLRDCSMREEGIQHSLLLVIKKVFLLSKWHGCFLFFGLNVHALPLQTGIYSFFAIKIG